MKKTKKNVLTQDTFTEMPVAQCDCACSGQEEQTFAPRSTLNSNRHGATLNPDLKEIYVDQDYSALISHSSVFSLIKTNLLKDLKEKGIQGLAKHACSKSDVKILYDTGILLNENKESSAIPSIPIGKELSVWLHITDRCNLRCDYCYLPHDNVSMSLKTLNLVIDSIILAISKYGYDSVKIKIAGGEATLNWLFFVDVVSTLQKAFEGKKLSNKIVLLTNGTLMSPVKAQFLKRKGVGVMISLDGLGNDNDKQRHYSSGRGSFDEVDEAISHLTKAGVEINVSITLTPMNSAGLPKLIQYLLDRKIYFGINFYRSDGLSTISGNLSGDEKTVIESLMRAYQVIGKNMPNYSLLSCLSDRANLSIPHQRPCKAGRDYLVYNTEGEISQCQMQLDKTVSSMHSIIPIDEIRSSPDLQNLNVDEKTVCKSCEWKYWCAGGCPVETFRSKSDYKLNSPNCNIYKAIFPEIIKLEAKRLLMKR